MGKKEKERKIFGPHFLFQRAPLVAQMVKNLPAMWEIWVQSLGWEDLLEKGMATHSGILTWRIHSWSTFSTLNLIHTSYFLKTNSKNIKDLSIIPKIIEGITGKRIFDLKLCKDFLDMISKS